MISEVQDQFVLLYQQQISAVGCEGLIRSATKNILNVRCSSLCTCKHTLMCKSCGVKSQQTALCLKHNRKASATTSERAEDMSNHENTTQLDPVDSRRNVAWAFVWSCGSLDHEKQKETENKRQKLPICVWEAFCISLCDISAPSSTFSSLFSVSFRCDVVKLWVLRVTSLSFKSHRQRSATKSFSSRASTSWLWQRTGFIKTEWGNPALNLTADTSLI